MSTTESEATTGLMLALMEPTPEHEEEFNDWYDSEHLPERAACPGFLTATRLVCVEGWPRYGALYDLEDIDVLHQPDYLSFAGRRPWSARVVSKVRGFLRWTGTQVSPGRALIGSKGLAPRLAVVRFGRLPPHRAAELKERLEGLSARREGIVQARLFQPEFTDDTSHLAIIESHRAALREIVDPAYFGEAAAHVDLMNLYVRYTRTEERQPMERTHKPSAGGEAAARSGRRP